LLLKVLILFFQSKELYLLGYEMPQIPHC